MVFSVLLNRSAIVLLGLIAIAIAVSVTREEQCDSGQTINDFYIPPEGLYFRIIGAATNDPLYSRTSEEPTFSSLHGDKRTYGDQWFSLVRRSYGEFLIKGRKSGKILYVPQKGNPGHRDPSRAITAPSRFKLEPGTGKFKGLTRLVVPYTSSVLALPLGTRNPVRQDASADLHISQFFNFEYEDMVIYKLEYHFDKGVIVAGEPQFMKDVEGGGSTYVTAINKDPVIQKEGYNKIAKITQTSTFERTFGFKITKGAEFTGDIPGASGTVAVAGSYAKDYKWGDVTSYAKTHTVDAVFDLPPKSKTIIASTITIGTLEVPFTMYLQSKSTGVQVQTHGNWRGDSAWSIRTNITSTNLTTTDTPM